ncbi:coiled-coil domain-containing protein 94-like [Sinocyclocheilus grahami]|uniref:Splicing factor YJU2 n=1 Tax=Sinocyclocheilus grahami TaxID=75366 RepID=A0A672N3Y7_SINGR|nr:PREDICTED: coiled-coil domain-containing protein 94-like [Sinocyclocheilus grahami]
MSERKVLNKYYPPDFDPSKIPKLKLPKDRQYVVRLMAPFNMRCKTCGEYIYKGKKFNARKETVQNELYLGLLIFRFYIKCTRCLAEITFKTDPVNTDYVMEHGATRNFQAEKLIEEEEKKIQQDREEEELNNPMKVLENRTRDSKLEMEVLENLQELKELNQRQAQVDFEGMLDQYKEMERRQRERELEEDERETKEMLERVLVKRLRDSDSEDETEDVKDRGNKHTADKPTDILTTDVNTGSQGSSSVGVKKQKVESWERSVGGLGEKGALGSLVVRKKPADSAGAPRQAANTQTGAGAAKPESSTASSGQPVTSPNGSSLSLLGVYTDSDDSNSD